MEELFNWGFSESEIRNIVSANNSILNLSDIEIKNKINILLNVGCDEVIIRNIIITNIFYLNRMEEDILELINKLYSFGIKDLDILFESNPFLLNMDAYEIDDFVNKKLKEGITLDDIIELIEIDSLSEV